MIAIYIFFLGAGLAMVSIIEFIIPLRSYSMWSRYIESKIFPFHGILLIAGGFPLVMLKGPLSTVIMVIGVVVILTGPFILIYPENVRGMYKSVTEDMDNSGIRRFIYFDASVRMAIGAIFVASYFF